MKVAIFGAAGTVGRAVAREISRRGNEVRVVGRSAAKLQEAFGNGYEIHAADVSREKDVVQVCTGVDAIVYTLGLPYSAKAFEAYPPMMRLAVAAARDAGVRRMLLVTNVYPYGLPRTPRVAETHPREPVSTKGRYRKEQEDILLSADGDGGLRTTSLRLPDFYGPHAELSFGNLVIDSAVRRKPASLLGPVDKPHEFVFTPDVAPVICDLMEREEACGEAYNFAGPGPISIKEFAEKVYAAAGVPFKMRVAGPRLVRVLGIFSSLMRELSEMSHLLTHPVLLDDTKLHRLLPNVRKTSYEDGIRLTLELYRGRG
jgi:nucleoside-diphosphate-sugar epimerase